MSRLPRARTKGTAPNPQTDDPYSWWRTRHPSSFNDSDVDRLHDVISAGPALLHKDWMAAREGDFAAAIGVAMNVTRKVVTVGPCSDIAMSLLVRNALCADQPSTLVVAYVLQRLARIKPSYRTLATAWLDRLSENA